MKVIRAQILDAVERNWNAGPDVLTDCIVAVVQEAYHANDAIWGESQVSPRFGQPPCAPCIPGVPLPPAGEE